MKTAGTKYNEAIVRNMASFTKRFHQGGLETLTFISTLSLEALKIRIGIKAADMGYDTKLGEVLAEAKAKIEAQKKAEKKAEVKAETNTEAKPAKPKQDKPKRQVH